MHVTSSRWLCDNDLAPRSDDTGRRTLGDFDHKAASMQIELKGQKINMCRADPTQMGQ